jgi:hypothetical protein
MNNPATVTTLKEWSSFLMVLNSKKNSSEPLVKKANSPARIVHHLEKQFVQPEELFQDRWYTVTKVKRRKIIPGQLSIWK